MLKLWFSEGSPFARKVRIVLAEKGLEYEKDIRDGLRPIDEHRHLHPGLAVPVLRASDLTLFESSLIQDYLLKSYPHHNNGALTPPFITTMTRPKNHWEDAKTLAILETITNAIVNLKLMRDSGATPDSVAYLKRQHIRIESCLDWLEERATVEGFAPGWFSVMDINLICPIAYAERREVYKLQGRPKLKGLIAHFAQRPSVRSTRIP